MPDKKAINITVALSHKGKSYKGIAVLNGVTLELVDTPCGLGGKLLSFGNTADAPTGVLFQGVTCIDDTSTAAEGYLQLKPLA